MSDLYQKFQRWQDNASVYDRCDLFSNYQGGYNESLEEIRLLTCLLNKERHINDSTNRIIIAALKQQIQDAEEVIRAVKEALQDGSVEFGHKEAVKILEKYGK